MKIEFSKSGALHTISGDAGLISSSTGVSHIDFKNFTKELANKIEQVKYLLQNVANNTKPVIISFPEANSKRSLYIMVADFTKFPDENRFYNRTEFYVGENELPAWLDYFINKYKTEPVQEKFYDEKPIEINKVDCKSKNIDAIVKAFSSGEITKLSQDESLEILGSLPEIYYKYISFAINADEQICKLLNIPILIQGNSTFSATSSNLILSDPSLLNYLVEYEKLTPCNSLCELSKLHIKLEKEYKDTEFKLDNKSKILELFTKSRDLELKEKLLKNLISLDSFGSNFSILSQYYDNIEKSKVIKDILDKLDEMIDKELAISRLGKKDKDTREIKNKLISKLGYTENSSEFIKSFYSNQILLIAIAIVHKEMGFYKKHLDEILEILRNNKGNLEDKILIDETIKRLEKLKSLNVESSPQKKKSNKILTGKRIQYNIFDQYESILLKDNRCPSEEVIHLFLYLFSVPIALNFLNKIPDEKIKNYQKIIGNWLKTNDTNLKTYNSDYESLKSNKSYDFYFKSAEKIKEESEAEMKKLIELTSDLEDKIQSCDNKFIIKKLELKEFEDVLKFLNNDEAINKLKENKKLKFNVKLGKAFYKHFDTYQTEYTKLFDFIDNQYPNEKNRFMNTMKNFKNFNTANKIVMIIGVIFFILGVIALFCKLNSRPVPPEVPINSGKGKNNTKQIENTSFKFNIADQTINLKTFCKDSAINNRLKNNFNNLNINYSTKAQIFFNIESPKSFMIFFKDSNSKYLTKYLEFEKTESWTEKICEGKPYILYHKQDMKPITVTMEP
jgi:hypothetical protein